MDSTESGNHKQDKSRSLACKQAHDYKHAASAHDKSLITSFEMGREMDLKLPEETIIFEIEAANVIDSNSEATHRV